MREREKLLQLGEAVYKGGGKEILKLGGKEILKLVDDVVAGRSIQV